MLDAIFFVKKYDSKHKNIKSILKFITFESL